MVVQVTQQRNLRQAVSTMDVEQESIAQKRLQGCGIRHACLKSSRPSREKGSDGANADWMQGQETIRDSRCFAFLNQFGYPASVPLICRHALIAMFIRNRGMSKVDVIASVEGLRMKRGLN